MQTFPATQHQPFLIPAGIAKDSAADRFPVLNVVEGDGTRPALVVKAQVR